MQRMCKSFRVGLSLLLASASLLGGGLSARSAEASKKDAAHICVGWYQGSPLYCSRTPETSFSVPETLERFVPDKYKQASLQRPPTDAFYFSLRFTAPAGQSAFWSDRFKLPILFESSVPNSKEALYFLGAFTQRGYARKQRLYMEKSLRKVQPDATLDMVQFRKDKGFVWVLSEKVPANLVASQPLLVAPEKQPMVAKAIPTQPAASVKLPAENKPTLKKVALAVDKKQTIDKKAVKTSPTKSNTQKTSTKPKAKVATAKNTAGKPRLQPVSYSFNEIFAIRLISYKTSVDWKGYLKRLTNKYFTKAAFPQPSGNPPYCRKTPKNSIFVYAQIHENEATLSELLESRPDWKKQGAYIAKLRDVSLKTCQDIMASI